MSSAEFYGKKTVGPTGGAYPAQIAKFKRPRSVLSVDAHYSTIPIDESPLELHANYSRCVINIIEQADGGMRVITGNLPARDISCLTTKIKWVLQDKMLHGNEIVNNSKERISSIEEGDFNALARSETFKMGAFKGKTPADVILENESSGLEAVHKQMEFLEQNVAKYPANQAVIDACRAALAAHSEGTLKPSDETVGTASSLIKVVYDTPIKFLASKKNSEGKFFVYQIKISCDYTKTKAPWSVAIMNGYSTVVRAPNGGANISEKITGKVLSYFNLTDDEAFSFADRLENDIRMFESCIYKHQYKVYLEAINSYKKNTGVSDDDNPLT